MDSRREQLVRFMHRRRRIRLLAVCVGTALVCGILAGLLAPKVLIGSVRLRTGLATEAKRHDRQEDAADTASLLLPLYESLDLDPREVRTNTLRWAAMSERERRVFFQRYWRLTELEPGERDQLIERYRTFRQLPRSRQEFLRERARNLRVFLNSLSPQDQAVLEGMGGSEGAERILELWRARYGTW